MSFQADKLDRSLDEMIRGNKRNTRSRGRGGNRDRKDTRGGAGPVDGVSKPQRKGKGQPAKAPAAPLPPKLMISNLPADVNEKSLQEFFVQAEIGRAKRVTLNYGPNMTFLRSAQVIFHNAHQTTKAVSKFDGIRIDDRTIKVEVIMDPTSLLANAAQEAPAVETTVSKRAHPKSAASDKKSTRGTASVRGQGRGRARARRGGGAPRQTKKTIEELDAEMEDWQSVNVTTAAAGDDNKTAAAANTAAAAADGDEMML